MWGGYIETWPLASDMTIICNEEGKLMNLPYNCRILNEHFVGTIIVAGIDGDEFTDCPMEPEKFEKEFIKEL